MSKEDELTELISKTMGWWKHETDDYHAHDGHPKKTMKVLDIIKSEVRKATFDELDMIPVIETTGVGYETIVTHRKERYRQLYEQDKA